MDGSQDYTLMLGYENMTHTVIRFKRSLDTCDMKDDFPITVSGFLKKVAESLAIQSRTRMPIGDSALERLSTTICQVPSVLACDDGFATRLLKDCDSPSA